MIDRKALDPWIQPQHLEDEAIRGYLDSFQAHPARMLFIRDFLMEAMADKLSRFLVGEGEFRVEYGLYSTEDAVEQEAWEGATEDDRFFRLGKLVGTPPRFQMSPNALTYLRFRRTFQTPEFKAFFEEVSGLSLGISDDFGAHYMKAGDFLRPHSDDNRNRQLALVLYLSPDWQPNYGGDLRMVDEMGTAHTIIPEFNSIVVFDVLAKSMHHIERIRDDAGERPRVTIGGWYPKPD